MSTLNTWQRYSVTTQTKIKHLVVGTPQGAAGDLYKEARFAFNYSANEPQCEISLTTPVRAESYSSGALLPIFEMNRPEGYLLHKIEKAFAKAGRLDDMRLLDIVGGEQIGRLRYTRPQERCVPASRQIGLAELLKRQPTSELFDFLVTTYIESGISGVQPKVLVPDADRAVGPVGRETGVHAELIVKSGGDEFPHLTQNEFMCMSAARTAGIETPKFWLSEEGGLLIVERFDLRNGNTLGFEDMTVLMNKVSRQKYGREQLRERGESGAALLFRRRSPCQSTATLRLRCFHRDGAQWRRTSEEFRAITCMSIRAIANQSGWPALYDVVTTSLYGVTNPRTHLTKYDRTLALNLHKSRNYPDRTTLLAFGRDHCGVARPA